MLPSGLPADGPVALTEALLARPDQFVQALTEKLLMYALGRELEYHDMRQVRHIVREAERQNYSLAAIVTGIVTSDAFRMQAAGEG
jgi:methyl coenzyme M reductase subunit C